MSKSNGGCVPPNDGPPDVIDDPCAVLGELRAAYYALLTGRQTAKVRHNNYEQWFNHTSLIELQREIRRLEVACPRGPNNPRGGFNSAVVAGPRRNPSLDPYRGPNRFR